MFEIKWRYDPRTCWTIYAIVSWTWKIQVTQRDSNPWPLRCRCSALTDWAMKLFSHDFNELTCSLCDFIAQSVQCSNLLSYEVCSPLCDFIAQSVQCSNRLSYDSRVGQQHHFIHDSQSDREFSFNYAILLAMPLSTIWAQLIGKGFFVDLPRVCLHAFQCNIVAKYVFVVLHDFL